MPFKDILAAAHAAYTPFSDMMAAGRWPLAVRRSLLAARRSLLAARCTLHAARCTLHAAGR
jgi:hypothetical protein